MRRREEENRGEEREKMERTGYKVSQFHTDYYLIITCIYHDYYLIITCIYHDYYSIITCIYHDYYLIITWIAF